MKAVRESSNCVYFLRASDLLATLAERSKYRNAMTNRIFHVDFGTRAIFITDDHCGAADILKTSILNPEFVEITRVDGDRRGHIPELGTDERQARFMLPDRSLFLAFKGAVDYRELPSWRRLAGPDAVFASPEMQILRHVATVMNSGKP